MSNGKIKLKGETSVHEIHCGNLEFNLPDNRENIK